MRMNTIYMERLSKPYEFFYINLTALKSLSNKKAAPKPKPKNPK